MEELKKLRELTKTLTSNGYLRDQAAEWEYALDAIPESIYIINRNYDIKFINKSLAQRLNLKSKEEVYNKKCYDVLHGVGSVDSQAKSGETPGCICDLEKNHFGYGEHYIKSLNGWYLYNRSPIYTETKKLLGYICVLRNITSRRIAEAKLKKSELKYRTLFEKMSSAAALHKVIVDDAGNPIDYVFLEVNDNFEKFTGCRKEDVLGKRLTEVFPGIAERSGTDFIKLYGEVGLKGIERKFETYYPYTDKYFFVSAYSPARGYFVTVFDDVSEIKAKTEKLNETTKTLSGIFEAAPIGIAVVRMPEREIRFVNDKICELTGYSKEELVGKSAIILYPNEEEYEKAGELKLKLVEEGGFGSIETKWRTKRGRILDIFLSSANHSNKDEIISTALDITYKKKYENELKLNEERLQSLLVLTEMESIEEHEITEYALEEAVRLTGSKVGYLHFVNEDQLTLELFSWSKATHSHCNAIVDKHYPLDKAGIWADCVRERKPVVHNDYRNLENKNDLPEGHVPIERHMSVPVFDKDKIVAVAGVGNKERPYNDSDVRQLSLFMNSMWDILKKIRYKKELESSEKKFKIIFEESPVVMTIIEYGTGKIVDINKAFTDVTGYSKKDAIGRFVYDLKLWANEERDRFYKELAGKNGISDFITEVSLRDGEKAKCCVSSNVIRIGKERYVLSIIDRVNNDC